MSFPHAYDPRIPPQRELERRIREKIAAQRGTCAQTRYGDQWILTCSCGALTVTTDMAAPVRFREYHAACREEEPCRLT